MRGRTDLAAACRVRVAETLIVYPQETAFNLSYLSDSLSPIHPSHRVCPPCSAVPALLAGSSKKIPPKIGRPGRQQEKEKIHKDLRFEVPSWSGWAASSRPVRPPCDTPTLFVS
jgi:hypothetical protein